MKNIKYIIMALICIGITSCMGSDYADPDLSTSPYGNNELKETNVVSIETLKQKYAHLIADNSMEEITEDIQIKGVVTGNDIQGNIYNEFAMQDNSGAILVDVAQGALYGYLPVGQEILISLKGMHIGSYRNQLKLGGVYTNAKTGSISIGRLNRFVWNEHYKLYDQQLIQVTPEIFSIEKMKDEAYLKNNCGKLMTIKNVIFKDANGKNQFAPNDGSTQITANAVNRSLVDISNYTLVVRTSTYAKFANLPLPEGPVNITGIFTRFGNTWQILIRSIDDVKPANK